MLHVCCMPMQGAWGWRTGPAAGLGANMHNGTKCAAAHVVLVDKAKMRTVYGPRGARLPWCGAWFDTTSRQQPPFHHFNQRHRFPSARSHSHPPIRHRACSRRQGCFPSQSACLAEVRWITTLRHILCTYFFFTFFFFCTYFAFIRCKSASGRLFRPRASWPKARADISSRKHSMPLCHRVSWPCGPVPNEWYSQAVAGGSRG